MHHSGGKNNFVHIRYICFLTGSCQETRLFEESSSAVPSDVVLFWHSSDSGYDFAQRAQLWYLHFVLMIAYQSQENLYPDF